MQFRSIQGPFTARWPRVVPPPPDQTTRHICLD